MNTEIAEQVDDGEMIDVTPMTEELESRRHQNMPYAIACGELADNSLDAGATRVVFKFSGQAIVSIEDNGCGCLDLAQMVTIGKHAKRKTTRLGRYGVGLKDVTCRWWARLVVQSWRDGQKMSGTFDVPGLARRGEWKIPKPQIEPFQGDGSGTKLTFYDCERGSPASFEALADELGFLFSPALRSGRQIEILVSSSKRKPKRILCKPYEFPMLDDKIEIEFVVGKRGVRLWAGIVKEGEPNRRPGFVIVHGHRVIRGSSSIGMSGYSMSCIAGQIELDGSWPLTKNKDDIDDSVKDELAAAISEKCRGLFERAKMRAQSMQLAELNRESERRLNQMVQMHNVKEKRGKGDETGTHPKGNGGRKRKRASRVQPGDKILETFEFNSEITIDWTNMGDPNQIGTVEISPPRINFNTANPTVERIQREQNYDAIAIAALSMLIDALSDHAQREMFPMMRDNRGLSGALGSALCKAQLGPEQSPKSKKRQPG